MLLKKKIDIDPDLSTKQHINIKEKLFSIHSGVSYESYFVGYGLNDKDHGWYSQKNERHYFYRFKGVTYGYNIDFHRGTKYISYDSISRREILMSIPLK